MPELIVYSHTHWDRAWYASFEEFRYTLVEHLDEVIDHLERHPEFRFYCCDGQTAMIEDYLAVRPAAEARIRALVSAGRLEIGPWYVQPDCFLPSAESLIRNLLHGARTARRFGACMRVGYLPDSFGFPSELPTILAGFGIDSMVFSRGMDAAVDRIGCEFWWRAASGARVLTLWMPQGYGAGTHLGFLTWWGDTRRQDFQIAHGLERLRKNIASQREYSRTGVTVVPNGVDHCPLNPEVPLVVAAAAAAMPEQHPRHGTLRSYVDAVLALADGLEEYQGELSSAAKGDQLRGVHSARLYLKQHNVRAEGLLEHWAEPLAAAASALTDAPSRAAQLQHLWMLLLQNHPHDDICGCSVDAVHQDDERRAQDVAAVARTIRREAAIALATAMDHTAQAGIPLVVYNPLLRPQQGVHELTLDLERQDLPDGPILLCDGAGKPVASQELGREPYEELWIRAIPYKRTRVRLLASVTVPPCGWTTLYLQAEGRSAAARWPGHVEAGRRRIANDHLEVQLHDDGRLDVLDRASGRRYTGLHAFLDQGDRGDLYDFCPCDGRPDVQSAGGSAVVETGTTGPEAWARITMTLTVPAAWPAGAQRTTIGIPIRTRLRLLAGSRRLDVTTTIENTASDHRLRVLLPTGLGGTEHFAQEHLGLVRRMDRVLPGKKWSSTPSPSYHQQGLVSCDDGVHGLTVLSEGLTEYEILPDRTIALTLVRAVGMLSRPDLSTRRGPCGPSMPTPDGQCLRTLIWSYAIVPHVGDARSAGMEEERERFLAPPWSFRGDECRETDSRRFDDPALSGAICFTPTPRGGHLPPHASIIAIDHPQVSLTACKPPEVGDGLIVRLRSRAATALEVRVRSLMPIARAEQTSLAEEPLAPLRAEDDAVLLTIPPAALVTLHLHPRVTTPPMDAGAERG